MCVKGVCFFRGLRLSPCLRGMSFLFGTGCVLFVFLYLSERVCFLPGAGVAPLCFLVFLFVCFNPIIIMLTTYHLPLNTYLLLTTYYLLLTYSLFIISTCLILFFVFTITHTHTTKHLLECYTKKPNSCWLNVRVLDCETYTRMRVCARVVWG